MRRWDRLLDSYLEEYRARGVSPQSVAYTEARLNRWGRWLKGRRPRIAIERIDPEMITRRVADWILRHFLRGIHDRTWWIFLQRIST